ncbi:MAG: type II toxin-antitoxin system PemK/MazF family toxin [candidate division KSB1 bacterium]|nr:type II toxin-antitoxin system PemK/MazF family toxin [candidate division KSB1 bacterium]MDZ7369130.1 type II toxin-antitoxin system PemK/MazF family toxin [candidate division KSB1 bacterium]MDZ7407107.1 type II toxin-antitoxin system PemK/MazF family toxin [candidate division KSB1 bacterium]
MDIERGWFYLANLSPGRGTEPGKIRPVLAIQTNLLNQHGHPSTIIVPITTNIQDNASPLRVRIKAGSDGFKVDPDIMIDQIRAIDNKRLYKLNSNELIKKIAPAENKILLEVEQCVKKVLDIF